MGFGRGPGEAPLNDRSHGSTDFGDLIAGRRMCRSFQTRQVERATVDLLIRHAMKAPSAGNTSSLQFLVLEGHDETSRYWDVTLDLERRAGFPWPGLLDAPVIMVPWVEPGAYVRRYGEDDKVSTGLGESADRWPVPYWFVDGGAAVMSVLLGAADAGLGSLFFGLFEHEAAVRQEFGVPECYRAVGAIALGHPLPSRPSSSAGRKKPGFDTVVHRGRW